MSTNYFTLIDLNHILCDFKFPIKKREVKQFDLRNYFRIIKIKKGLSLVIYSFKKQKIIVLS